MSHPIWMIRAPDRTGVPRTEGLARRLLRGGQPFPREYPMKNIAALTALALAAACGGSEMNAQNEDNEAWSAAGNPALFASDLEYKYAALPLKGQAKVIPWTGSYWPTASDNINYRWDGSTSDSPAKKYE